MTLRVELRSINIDAGAYCQVNGRIPKRAFPIYLARAVQLRVRGIAWSGRCDATCRDAFGEMMTSQLCTRLGAVGSLMLGLAAAPVLGAGAFVPDTSDVATLSPSGPHRFFTSGGQAFNILNADSGKLEGSIPAGYAADLAIAPDNTQFYVSETYWAHGSRGERQDLVSIWDAKTLNLVKEVALPGRMLVGGKLHNLDISADGSKLYTYVMSPASAVVWVDLKKQVVSNTIEIPGCALIFPWGDAGFSSLCGDGSLATVTISEQGAAEISHTKPFFDANKDPIYENSFVDRVTGDALFLTYTGLVYQAKLGARPVIEKPWSIQQAAGYALAGTGVQELAWRPGGGQPAAYHKATGKLFVLMHVGNYWTHKQGGTEIWVLDSHAKSVVKRFALQPIPTSGLGDDRVPFYTAIGVSQDAAKPLLYLLGDGGTVVLDATSGETVRKIDFAGGGTVMVTGF
jgi:methylamine dehydrogenase heavy chain